MIIPCNALPFRRHALALALAFAVGAAHATSINVNADCSLFNAINNANTDTDTDGVNGCPAGSGADILNLPLNSTQSLNNGLPAITSIITINGNGSTVDGLGNRPFNISTAGDLTLNRLTVKNGRYAQRGGGIQNLGKLTMVNSTVTDNGTYWEGDSYLGAYGVYGGGIFNAGTATLTNSTVANNLIDVGFTFYGVRSGLGGGIFNSGSMTLTNSRVSNNKTLGSSSLHGQGPSSGGGIINYGVMALNNTTVSGNSAATDGGGIRNRGIMALDGSTVSGNSADNGGGINNGSGHFIGSNSISLTLTNSTVSGNSAFSGGGIRNAKNLTLINTTLSGNRAAGIVNSGNLTLINSLIANSRPANSDCLNGSGAIVIAQGINLVEDGSCGADISGDPKLGALLNNGGTTATHALLSGSDALDFAIKKYCPATDQRGVKRPQPFAGNCDLGAFEGMTTVPSVVKSVVDFFDNAIISGGIVGTGWTGQNSLVIQRSNALHNQLLGAGHYKSRGLGAEACAQLRRTLDRIDPNNTPDANDYVTGNEAGTLTEKLKALRVAWTCK
ncbi:MAG: choice-of-anchor Q domain-containing protein [Methylococcales bacterium]|nr:choice-of-anchor Q domain-containing protein [Methylococcales bacterium]